MISLLNSRQNLRLFLFLICCSSRIFDTTGEDTITSEVVIQPDGVQVVSESVPPMHHQHGVDFSWPVHYHDSEFLSEQQKEEYLRYIEGCSVQMRRQQEHFSCHKYEQDRMDMNLNQPKMMENYTHSGFAKVQTPPSIQKLLQTFWEANHMEKNSRQEIWDSTNTYVNHWQSPTSMLDIARDSPNIPNPLSHQDRWDVVKGVQSVLEAWTKAPLVLTSLYGIRVYHEGSILAPHVDRLPLVSSAILNIAQDVDEPWILEVIGHNGKAHNLTMLPGEMVLYESHSVIHGRPFPMKGRFYANLFVHFEPLGHTLRHVEKHNENGEMDENVLSINAKAAYEKAFEMEELNNSHDGELATRKKKSRTPSEVPHYVHPDKEIRWNQHFDYDMKPKVTTKPLRQPVSMTPHNAAAAGNLEALKTLAENDRAILFKSDQNGWRPLHEAARSGHVHVLKYLLKEGARVNERTNDGEGGNPLWWAEKNAEGNQEAIKLLKKHGAVSLKPRILDEKEKKEEAGDGQAKKGIE